MTTNKIEIHGGMGFFGLLTIAFIVLKLCNVITWSWFWVLSPTIIPLIILLVFCCGLIVIMAHGFRYKAK